KAAHDAADRSYLKTIRRVRDNILSFQSGILNRDALMRRGPGCELKLRYRPLRRVGVCIPGGAAAYPSSLLMTVVPAPAAGTADPRYVAADLISQAEHSPGASVLITWEPDLVERVAEALCRQLAVLSRGELARESLERFGALILVRDEDEAVALTNLIAPEH